jgi:DNA-binding LacI/PurR family transcriptional regulator
MGEDTGTIHSISKHWRLAEGLRELIRERAFTPGQMVGSEHEMARSQGVSRVTMRKASAVLVNEGLIERRPGKGLYVRASRPRTAVVQVVVGDLRSEACLQVSLGVKAASNRAGYQVQLYDAHADAEFDLEVIRQLPNGPTRGAVIVSFSSQALNRELYGLKSKGFPFVLVDQRLRDIDVHSVTSDNTAGGHQVGCMLIRKGHTRVAFIGDLASSSVQARLDGFRNAFCDAALPFDRSLVANLFEGPDEVGDWSVCIELRVREVMASAVPPTAIFCSCDAVARVAYRALAAMGLSIPGDVSVVGFNDDPLAELVSPALTTVRQDFQGMGQEAMNLLCKRMVDPHSPVEHRVLSVDFIERDSVAAVESKRLPLQV